MHYGDKIRRLREQNGYSQRKLAGIIEMNHHSISNWEPLPNPPLEYILKTCAFFNLPLSEFFTDKDDTGFIEYSQLKNQLDQFPEAKRKEFLEHCCDLAKMIIES